ncbi:MAG: methyltransferase domain-containing protein [Deltaproteobacteria bacterium]|nr:methyltransferase domain-containing protein [Deltaproteobacteria bacterium]
MKHNKSLPMLIKIQRRATCFLRLSAISAIVIIARLVGVMTSSVTMEVKSINVLNRYFDKRVLGGRRGHEDYFFWQLSSAKKIYDYIQDKSFSFAGKCILDIGCGRGGKTSFYKCEGAATVIGIDLREEALRVGSQLTKKHGIAGNVGFIKCDGAQLPFRSESFDLVIMNDIVEHISPGDLRRVLRQARAVLKSDGSIMLDFSPYFNAYGSHLYDYVYIPYCHLLFSKKALVKYCETKTTPFVIKQFQELNKITVKRFFKIVSKAELRIDRKLVFSSNNVLKRIPIVNNLFINKVFCILGK